MDVVADRDVRGGEADDLAVAAHRLAGPRGATRDLVAGPDVLPHLDAAAASSSTVPAAISVLAMATSSSGFRTIATSVIA